MKALSPHTYEQADGQTDIRFNYIIEYYIIIEYNSNNNNLYIYSKAMRDDKLKKKVFSVFFLLWEDGGRKSVKMRKKENQLFILIAKLAIKN